MQSTNFFLFKVGFLLVSVFNINWKMFTNPSFWINSHTYGTDFLHLLVFHHEVDPTERTEEYTEYCEGKK